MVIKTEILGQIFFYISGLPETTGLATVIAGCKTARADVCVVPGLSLSLSLSLSYLLALS